MVAGHKPGAFKQKNKSHKFGRHKTKGMLDQKTKGRVGNGPKGGSKALGSLSKKDRKHQSAQIRKAKILTKTKEKGSLGVEGTAPIIVVMLPAGPSIPMDDVMKTFNELEEEQVKNYKNKFHFVAPGGEDLFEQLDSAKCADVVIIVWGQDEMDPLLRTCLLSQGVPTMHHLVLGDDTLSKPDKVIRKKRMGEVLEQTFPTAKDKVHFLDDKTQLHRVLWELSNFKQSKLSFRAHRSYMITSDVDFEQTSDTAGTLQVTGYLRGRGLSADQLVHLPGLGHYKISKIELARDGKRASPGEMFEEQVLSVPTDKQQSLEMEGEVDEMNAEQTWPTEEELEEAEQGEKQRKVPKGTSSYQAAWFQESDDGGDLESEDEEEGMEDEDDEGESEEESESGSEYEDIDTASQASEAVGDYDVHFDEEMERQELEKFREAREDEAFPDEVDTPQDVDARIRFQKYRGLKSFRTTPWDPKENLPLEYAKIWQLPNFKAVRKYMLKHAPDGPVKAGTFVKISIENVPISVVESTRSSITVFSLLPHEQRMSVQHSSLQRHPQCDMVVKSKEEILMQIGFRRYTVRPIYSQHTRSNKHKFERFMPTTGAFVASAYAPMIFSNAPVVLFKREVDGTVTLLSSGSLLSSDPDRVIVKRVVLSGHPCKINKRTATIRYMFHNPDDIHYFKPVELKTKYGKRGHIKQTLGTHGHMKVGFDGQLKQNDTVLMCLYKRVFPKLSFSYS